MRDVFHGYFPLTQDQYRELFSTALVVLDTNALLNLYRYSPKSREELLKALDSMSSRMWMPHHVGVEFNRRRLDLIKAQLKLDKSFATAFSEISKTVESQLGQHAKNAFIDTRTIIAEIQHTVSEVSSRVQSALEKQIGKYGVNINSDPLIERVADLYAGRVGAQFSEEDWQATRQEGDERYENDVPPGYLDRKKGGDDKYGDLVIWKQIIVQAKAADVDVLFVTDDAKEDWWWKVDGKVVGPRPELREEFRKLTGRTFYAYTAERFVEILKENQSLGVSAEAVEEVRETSRRIADAQKASIRAQSVERALVDIEDEIGETESALLATKNEVQLLGQILQRSSYDVAETEVALQSADEAKARLSDIDAEIARHEHVLNMLNKEGKSGTGSSIIDENIINEPAVYEQKIVTQQRLHELRAQKRSIFDQIVSARNDYDRLMHERSALMRERDRASARLAALRENERLLMRKYSGLRKNKNRLLHLPGLAVESSDGLEGE